MNEPLRFTSPSSLAPPPSSASSLRTTYASNRPYRSRRSAPGSVTIRTSAPDNSSRANALARVAHSRRCSRPAAESGTPSNSRGLTSPETSGVSTPSNRIVSVSPSRYFTSTVSPSITRVTSAGRDVPSVGRVLPDSVSTSARVVPVASFVSLVPVAVRPLEFSGVRLPSVPVAPAAGEDVAVGSLPTSVVAAVPGGPPSVPVHPANSTQTTSTTAATGSTSERAATMPCFRV